MQYWRTHDRFQPPPVMTITLVSSPPQYYVGTYSHFNYYTQSRDCSTFHSLQGYGSRNAIGHHLLSHISSCARVMWVLWAVGGLCAPGPVIQQLGLPWFANIKCSKRKRNSILSVEEYGLEYCKSGSCSQLLTNIIKYSCQHCCWTLAIHPLQVTFLIHMYVLVCIRCMYMYM